MTVRFSAAAIAEVEAVRDYVAEHDPQAADRVVRRIGDVVELLRDFPRLGHRGAVAGTFEIVVPRLPYIVVYELGGAKSGDVVILRVFHGAQNRSGDSA